MKILNYETKIIYTYNIRIDITYNTGIIIILQYLYRGIETLIIE